MMNTDRLSSWVLHGLHFGLALSIPFLLLLLAGCTRVKEEPPDYGPQVSADAVDLALSKAVQGASLDNVAVGQYLDHTVNRRLENEENTTTLGGTRVEVIDKQESADSIKYTLRIFKSERVAGGGFEVKITEEPLVLDKASLLNIGKLTNMSQARLSAASLASQALSGQPEIKSKVTGVTYHRLVEFTKIMPPPKAVRERAGCGGLSPCELQVRYIQFDVVQWYDDGSRVKVSLDFGFTVQPPYLPFGKAFDQFTGLMVVDCRSTYVPIDNRTVYVRDCMTLDDFQK